MTALDRINIRGFKSIKDATIDGSSTLEMELASG
jgi:hypothetical protein